MQKDTVTHKGATMFAKTIPVQLIFDEIYEPTDFPEEVIAERFKVIEVDGAYIVLHECIRETKPSTQEFKAFCLEDDAFSYLEMLGVERDKQDE